MALLGRAEGADGGLDIVLLLPHRTVIGPVPLLHEEPARKGGVDRVARELADEDGEGREEVVEEEEPEILFRFPAREIEEHIAELPEFPVRGAAKIPEPPLPVAKHDGMVGSEEVLHHPWLKL